MSDEVTKPEEPSGIQDLNHFVTLLSNWHTRRVNRLQELLNMPEGTQVTMNEGPPTPLEGDLLKGFRLGISLALTQLGTLPFEAEYEPPADGTAH